MTIILLGYMASGKSTIGKHIAKRLNFKFIDLDDYISEQEGLSVSNIFKLKGEIYFRRIEHNYLQELLKSTQNTILSLGGGTPCYGSNMALIKASKALSFYINVSLSTLEERLLKEKHHRPLVASLPEDHLQEFVAKHLFERAAFYNDATYTIAATSKDVATIAEEIIGVYDKLAKD